jgi:hypothetical protein
MGRSRRLLLATACVEAVAVASVFAYGYLSLVAVAILYWIDLLFLNFRVMIQRLITRKTTSKNFPLGLLPFRLLKHKRGSVTVSDRLPPIYPRNVPETVGPVFLVLVSIPTTVYVSAVYVPTEFWSHPATPFVLVAGTVAAATKSVLILKEYVASEVHQTEPAKTANPGMRLLLFVVYAALLRLVSQGTVDLLAENGLEATRNGLMFCASVVIVLRLGYGVRASRTRFGGSVSEEEGRETTDDGLVSRILSKLSGEKEGVVLSPPPVPEDRPFETAEPRYNSILAAGIVNAVTTGGVVDKEFSTRGTETRIGILLIIGLSTLALLNGSVRFFVLVVGGVLVLFGLLSALSAVHMHLALGGVEYRFYDSEVVAYDRRLGVPQWSVPYDSMEDVSVERGLFGSPLWLDAGTVFFERTDSPKEDDLEHQDPRSSIAFVSNPERVVDIVQTRGSENRA